METKNKLRYLVIYLLFFYVFTGIVYFLMSKKNINRKDFLINDNFFYVDKNLKNSPCDKTLFGEPLDSKNDFIKVNFFCDYKRNSKNTLSLLVLKERRVLDVINEISRINNFKLENYKCFYEGKLINNFSQRVESNKRIDCLAEGLKITDFYHDENN